MMPGARLRPAAMNRRAPWQRTHTCGELTLALALTLAPALTLALVLVRVSRAGRMAT